LLGLISAVDLELDDQRLMKVSWTRELSSVDPVHETMDIFYDIFFRKIILKNLKIPRPLNFYILPPKLF
jgi:hypothetical protein